LRRERLSLIDLLKEMLNKLGKKPTTKLRKPTQLSSKTKTKSIESWLS
jgi:hypothetical protein